MNTTFKHIFYRISILLLMATTGIPCEAKRALKAVLDIPVPAHRSKPDNIRCPVSAEVQISKKQQIAPVQSVAHFRNNNAAYCDVVLTTEVVVTAVPVYRLLHRYILYEQFLI